MIDAEWQQANKSVLKLTSSLQMLKLASVEFTFSATAISCTSRISHLALQPSSEWSRQSYRLQGIAAAWQASGRVPEHRTEGLKL
jgi:hypothetical protein